MSSSPLCLPAASDAELPEHEKAFIQFHITMPEGPSLRVLLQDPEERRKLGKYIYPWGRAQVWVMKPRIPVGTGFIKAPRGFGGISLCEDNFYWVFFEKSLSWRGRKASRFPVKVLGTARCACVDPSGQM